jgi:hypothetical protein
VRAEGDVVQVVGDRADKRLIGPREGIDRYDVRTERTDPAPLALNEQRHVAQIERHSARIVPQDLRFGGARRRGILIEVIFHDPRH